MGVHAQDIASDCCFTVAMACELEGVLRRHGAPGYARAHWECGALGQVCEPPHGGVGVGGGGCGPTTAEARPPLSLP